MPEVLNDCIPILSPALGFRRDLAMVTVSIMERLKDNRLNIQPYLVTSTRELRLLQPLAFNMITTSDPTGASMFRLIHQTGCAVGIDEAERYHNPKDPAMMQIRQLLNSGYKHEMPAIRLIGEAMKPQTFDVYSPKILAAILGLEDVLASRCIAIPMRRTDKKMPSFAANFDGAALRHQLYSLGLTHFQPIFTNYFERPELHTLHNIERLI